MTAPVVMSLEQAARRAGVSTALLRKEIRDGKLHAIPNLSAVRIVRSELLRWKRERGTRDRFPIKEITDRPTVYWLENRSHRLLYVGYTRNLGARLRSHSGVQPWWGDVTHVSVRYYPTPAAALRAEAKSIALDGPLYNKARPPAGRDDLAELGDLHFSAMYGGGEWELEQTRAH